MALKGPSTRGKDKDKAKKEAGQNILLSRKKCPSNNREDSATQEQVLQASQSDDGNEKDDEKDDEEDDEANDSETQQEVHSQLRSELEIYVKMAGRPRRKKRGHPIKTPSQQPILELGTDEDGSVSSGQQCGEEVKTSAYATTSSIIQTSKKQRRGERQLDR